MRTYVSRVIASAAGAGVAYATFDAHRDGDLKPYVFRTDNFGRTWTPLVRGLPADGSVNVIREHPRNPNLLFVGTEHGAVRLHRSWRRVEAVQSQPAHHTVRRPRDSPAGQRSHRRDPWAQHLRVGRPHAARAVDRAGGAAPGARLPHPACDHLQLLGVDVLSRAGGVRGRESGRRCPDLLSPGPRHRHGPRDRDECRRARGSPSHGAGPGPGRSCG